MSKDLKIIRHSGGKATDALIRGADGTNSLSTVNRSNIQGYAARSGTTPKIQISEGGSMLLSMPKTPRNETQGSHSKPPTVKVMEENEYINEMEKIIGRDFFPGIQEMQKRIDMIDYLLRNGEAPAFENAEEVVGTQSLTEFQRKHTSEDNSSFNDLMEKHSHSFREKYPWLSNKGINLKSNGNMLLESGKESRQPTIELVARMTPQIEYENRIRAQKLGWTDERETNLQSWPTTDKRSNTLITYPNEHASGLTESQIKSQAAKQIQYGQTRFSGDVGQDNNPTESQTSAAMPSRSDILNAILGNTSTSSKSSNSNLPEVDGYSFVTENTYKTSASNPGMKETPDRAFTIPEPPKRDAVHHRLLDRKLALRKQEKDNPMGGKSLSHSTPNYNSTHTNGRISKTPMSRSARDAVKFSPAGSHLLASLKQSKTPLASSSTLGRSFSTAVTPRRTPTSSSVMKKKAK